MIKDIQLIIRQYNICRFVYPNEFFIHRNQFIVEQSGYVPFTQFSKLRELSKEIDRVFIIGEAYTIESDI